MFHTLETGIGLDIVLWLQAHSSPVLDTLARVMYSLGSVVAYVLLVAVVFWALSRTRGLRLMVVMLVALAVTDVAKTMLARPRPFQIAPDLVRKLMPFDGTGYGIPSGHVLVALVVVGYLAWTFQSWRVWAFTVVYVVVMGWSRMAAGVHYPQDVLAGLILGIIVLALVVGYMHRLTGWLLRQPLAIFFGIVGAAALGVVLLTAREASGYRLSGLILGMGIAVIIERRAVRIAPGGRLLARIVRVVLGIVFVVAIFGAVFILTLGRPAVWNLVRFALVPLLAIAVWPWLCVKTGLAASMPVTRTT